MLTLFTIPKAFRGHFALIQDNAIGAWVRLGRSVNANAMAQFPDIVRTGLEAHAPVRVVLFGDDEGVGAAAARHGVGHEARVARNEYGTPLLDDLFARVRAVSSDPWLGYVNADIVLMDDFRTAFERIARAKKRLLMVGQRTDLNVTEAVDFGRDDWTARLRADVAARGVLHRPTGIDYFIFHRDLWEGGVPSFAIGRFSWDNWLIHRARQLRVPVIDATAAVLAIHQNHDYSHAAGGLKGARDGPEARLNFRLAGGRSCSLTVWDSTHVLTQEGELRLREFDAALGGGIWSYRRAVG